MFGDATSELLAIVVLPAAAGLICLCLVILQNARAAANDKPQEPSCRQLRNTLGVLSITDAYDPERNVLWEHQILALQRIGKQINYAELDSLWQHYQYLYPELYEGVTLCDWLGFLRDCNLARFDGSNLRLTKNGRNFLDFLICNTHLSHHQG